MSRSFRKTPVIAVASAASEKDDKRIWHGRLRAQTRTRLNSLRACALEDFAGVDEREVSNPWAFAKDGKVYLSQRALWRYISLCRRPGEHPHRTVRRLFGK